MVILAIQRQMTERMTLCFMDEVANIFRLLGKISRRRGTYANTFYNLMKTEIKEITAQTKYTHDPDLKPFMQRGAVVQHRALVQ